MTCARCGFSIALATIAFFVTATSAYAQLAPTGTHYAGRSSDTGHSVVGSSGGYAASVPLDLPAARGGIEIPVALAYGTRGLGAGGLGWDVPLSYVRRDATVSRRRPSHRPGGTVQPREQIVVSLAGRTFQMERNGADPGSVWLARQDGPTLELRAEPNDTWRLRDGNGRTFVFTAAQAPGVMTPEGLVGRDLWLLTSVTSATGVNRMDLEYEVISHYFSGWAGIAIDLVSVRYNTHPTTPDCSKIEVRLLYLPTAPAPLSLALLYDVPIVRMRTLGEIHVLARETCASSAMALRRYKLEYGAPDPDTKLPRLSAVRMFGRDGTPEANTSLPVATYGYGTATENSRLRYQRGPDIALPADLTGTPPIANTVHDSAASSPDGGETYVNWQNLVDVTGDGRPDLTYLKNGELWLAANRPAAGSATALSTITQLSGPQLPTGPLGSHASESVRHAYNFRNQDHVWRQIIDVNGDGRLDIIDATEEAGYWTIYMNTPGSPVTWAKRSWRVTDLRTVLEARGHVLDGDHVPLARRTTGFNTELSECWRWDYNDSKYEPHPTGFQEGHCYGTGTKPIVSQRRRGYEKTFTEWELRDVNGDGYPDVVYNSSPVRHMNTYVPPTQIGEQYLHVIAEHALVTGGNAVGPIANPNAIMGLLNVVGVRIDSPPQGSQPFSAPVALREQTSCGVALWQDECNVLEGEPCGAGANRQHQECGIDDVNGDGIADRIENGNGVYLGAGDHFIPSVTLTLPDTVRQQNPQATTCENAPSSTIVDPRHHSTLRDLTGDDLPDFIEFKNDAWQIWIGTGTRFNAPIPIDVLSDGFAISNTRDNCGGTFSQTLGGLYDIDGDGKPEVVHVKHLPTRLEVYHLAGATLGNPQAGRLSTVDNGHGALTTITYRSAKEDSSTGHQVPFPEIVVTAIETTGLYGFGGRLSAVRYAYGDAEMFFDPGIDRFTMRAYGTAIEVHGTGQEDWDADFAIVRETYRLEGFNPLMDDGVRFERYQKVGRVRDTYLLTYGVERDPWLLLDTFDPFIDMRRTGGARYEWKTRYVPVQPVEVSVDCFDVMDPYDWAFSFGHNIGYSPCGGRGFTYTQATESWRGTQPPGSSASNVETRSEVIAVDDFGNVLQAMNENDRYRADDDLCIDLTYATPGTDTRILSAVATRRITNCAALDVGMLSYESWEYDGSPVGSVALGRTTSHTVDSHATDSGEVRSSIREFEADYDSLGNPSYIVTAREDGAVRSVTIDYDTFGLVPIASTVDASGLDPLSTSFARDPLSLATTATQDPNGTTWGVVLDGFEREVWATVTPPQGALGVVSTTTYGGFSGGDPDGRTIRRKELRDPVSPDTVESTAGAETVAWLDELGRTKRVEQLLGDDYSGESLVVLSRAYDGHGRVSFDAEPYPVSQDGATAYGTTFHYYNDSSMRCSIRGHGPQPLTSSTDRTAEIFPTCYTQVFDNHTVRRSVTKPDAVDAGSPQLDVVYTDTMSAIGWVLSRETSNSEDQLEHADYSYDPLGQLVALTRYMKPSGLSGPVQWSWRLDSRGQTFAATEPEVATRHFNHSDWGELLDVAWTDPVNGSESRLVRSYDALGRITDSEEWLGSSVIPESINHWSYDTPVSSPLPSVTFTAGRLTRTKSAIGDMHLSYDAFGNVEARAFLANGEEYHERVGRQFDGAMTWLEFLLPDTNYKTERYEYAYDTASRLRLVDDVTRGARLYTAHVIDPLGRVRAASHGDTEYTATYSDTGRRLPVDYEIRAADKSHRRVEYVEYDAIGRELERHEVVNGGTPSITTNRHDPLGRIVRSAKDIGGTQQFLNSFTYDPLGNVHRLDEAVSSDLVSLTFSALDLDRLCRVDYGAPQAKPCNVYHDGSGNIIEQPTPTGTRSLEFYPSGAVKKIEQGSVTADFRYDGSGEMFELDVSGPFLQDARSDRRYGLIERREVEVDRSMKSVIVRQIPGPGGIVASLPGNDGRWIFPFGEHRGTRLATDDTSIVQDVEYLPFGKATSSGATASQPEYTKYQWNGGDALADLGIVHLGARLYDPTIGRFLSRDPLLIPRSGSSTNPYAFALNNPIDFADPSGLNCQSPEVPCDPAPIFLPGFPGSSDSNRNGILQSFSGPRALAATYALPMGRETFLDTLWDISNQYNPLELNKRFLKRAYNVAAGQVTIGRALRSQVGDTANVAAAMMPGGTWLRAAATGLVAGGGAAIESGSLGKGAFIGALTTFGARIGDKIAARFASNSGAGSHSPMAGTAPSVNAIGGADNCVSCAIATDATLAGAPASALGGGPYDVLPSLAKYLGRDVVGIPANGIKGVGTMMRAWGPGTRAIIWGTRPHLNGRPQPGHVFNGVVSSKGVVSFLDGQTGKAATVDGYLDLYVIRTN